MWQDPKRREEASTRAKKYNAEPPEVAKRAGLKNKGRKHTEETRKKLSIFQKSNLQRQNSQLSIEKNCL